MDITCISDLHGHYPKLPGGDLLIVAGDLTARDTEIDHFEFYVWAQNQSYNKIVIIPGNHDNFLVDEPCPIVLSETKIIEFLCDSGTEYYHYYINKDGILEGRRYRIWGSPWTSQFPDINPNCCAFTRHWTESLKDRWDLIPDNTDILITHSPPHGILDRVKTEYGANVGDIDLLHALQERLKPKLHVFGHIHENGGQQMVYKRPGYGTENNTIMVNASIVNEMYKHVNKPVRIVL